MESRYRHLWPSLDWSRSRHPANFPVSMSLGLDIQQISKSRWVSVSTSSKFPSLDESRSRHPANFQVSMSLGLDILEISQSRWVSVSTSKKLSSLYQVCFPDHQNPNWNGWDIECSFHKKNISFLCSQEVAQKFMVVGWVPSDYCVWPRPEMH